jgi:hypothetical protein
MKVVAFLYEGTELPSDILSSMCHQMENFVAPNGGIITKKFNENDLTKLCVKSLVASTSSAKNEEVERAATYISTRFGNLVKEPVKFILSMSEIRNSTDNEAVILRNAVKIISENKSNSILKQYNITPSVVNTIIEFNNSYHV